MKTLFADGTLKVYLNGRIDTTNTAEIEKKIESSLTEYTPSSLILDADKLDYISSSGLRVILKLRKQYESLRVINVQTHVYEIFDMTGFTEICTVEKAYRTFDVSGCELIGEGANGMVYRVSPDTIVKVYKSADSLDEIKRERELSRTAFILGIPTAIPYDVVKVGETYGSVFELLNAKSFAELMREDESNLEFVAAQCAEIMQNIHTTKAPDNLPRQRDTALHWVGEVTGYFSDEELQKLRTLIENIPENGKMIHGDLHIKNLMSQNGETLLIDMDTLCTAHPIYELAFCFNAYKGFGLTDENEVAAFFDIPAATAYRLWRRILSLYLGTEDETRLNEVEEKASLIGYLRVMRRVLRIGDEKTEKGKALVDACHDEIQKLIEKYDTLTF